MTRKDLVATINPKTGVEIGVLEGIFSEELLTIPTLQKLTLVDPWKFYPGDYEKDVANVDQEGQNQRFGRVFDKFRRNPRVEIIRQESIAAADLFDNKSLDFAFIDSQHDENSVYADLCAWSRVARVLFCHDYTDRPEAISMGFGVIRAVDSFCKKYGWKVAFVTSEDWATAMITEK